MPEATEVKATSESSDEPQGQSQDELQIDPAVREQVMRQRAQREAREQRQVVDASTEPGDRAGAVKAAAKENPKLNEQQVLDATEWFLADDEQEITETIQLNVGTELKKKWISWVIKPIDPDQIRRIQKEAQSGNRQQRRLGNVEIDQSIANLGIAVAGTVHPDLPTLARQMGSNHPDPAQAAAAALKHRFRQKGGLIGQISIAIQSLSGYDDEDMRVVEAAGN